MKKIYFSFLILLFAIGCASPKYSIPRASQGQINKELMYQLENKIEEYRQNFRDYTKLHCRLDSLISVLYLSAVGISKQKDVIANDEIWWMTTDLVKNVTDRAFLEAARREYGIDNNPRKAWMNYIVYVRKTSPAYQAGIRPGDRILAIYGQQFKSPKEAERIFYDTLKKHGFVTYKIYRAGEVKYFKFIPRNQSKFSYILTNSKQVGAFADGKNVYITKGMLDFVKNDRELQFVVAHELAHNIEHHVGKKKTNAILGGILGAVVDGVIQAKTGYYSDAFTDAGLQAGVIAYSKDFERESDYLGAYILARAGIPLDGISDFWRRLAEVSPQYSRTHPTYAERFVNLDLYKQEIDAKILMGIEKQELYPNKK